MTRFRTRSLAILGAGVMLALSVSTAFAAHPQNADTEHPGQWVASFVHFQLFGTDAHAPSKDANKTSDEQQDENTDQQGDQQDSEQTDQTTTQDSPTTTDAPAASNHGQCVKDIARGDAVGDPNNNHGGAVSAAARVDCWQTGSGSEDPPTEVSAGPGNSTGDHGKKDTSPSPTPSPTPSPPTEVSAGPGNSTGDHGGGKP